MFYHYQTMQSCNKRDLFQTMLHYLLIYSLLPLKIFHHLL
ncbi:hypothetical protein SMI10712_01958 [Streptococcus mitis]|uniref:Uncharacterized protein n=1 Tax=Streptococcus mitis TaxID=28037 RepID=A0A150NIM6_STRMT|nr:hypothetical protein SMI10712_01958 [Streptococcus mitis]